LAGSGAEESPLPGKGSAPDPRLAQLLHILMQHGGEVVERENLFAKPGKPNISVIPNPGCAYQLATPGDRSRSAQAKIFENYSRVGYRLDT